MTSEVKKQVVGYILAAFGLVAGLAWNDAIRGLIDYLYPLGQDGLPAKFIYAGVITLVLVTISSYLIQPEQK